MLGCRSLSSTSNRTAFRTLCAVVASVKVHFLHHKAFCHHTFIIGQVMCIGAVTQLNTMLVYELSACQQVSFAQNQRIVEQIGIDVLRPLLLLLAHKLAGELAVVEEATGCFQEVLTLQMFTLEE